MLGAGRLRKGGARRGGDTAIGPVQLAKHRLESEIADKMDLALPPASGGLIADYDSDGADAVAKALTNAVKISVGHIDSLSREAAQGRLAEAQAGMGG
jgi:hypothetical protein